ncbi:CCA tRNA nucleotidyltransferase [Thermosediminibacter oceani]|uniref:Polynucleotide adenylyltransferase/metal dependent phosphohydrolase n=1 Tax=Thermosediminibacter oceani (strain ATCC BAA-1034 / DSM 16646 / JW/IW-1228P) TaxID=555079 RepID=D9RY20_THEOJ|nr:CCA tRNA nucleotidyltransferase [Thermosediminibacter oceani]ADL08244.1 polynucleotide adenylyltransferase/metal dependent phosphohydrolase [Thermosediminibacter oceani DSM 16646]
MELNVKIPVIVKQICLELNTRGHQAFVVGGALRDIILGRESPDYDIATDALPERIASIFADAIPYGNFGTMLLIRGNTKIEVTPFRDDAPGRKPHYTFGGTIYTDLARRDFTINSMAYDPITGQFIDPFGGLNDLKARTIRCTGSTKRVWEDPLRALRAARFQAQLGFAIEPSTMYSLKAYASMLDTISRERIRDELSKLITSDHPFDGLVTLVVTGLMNYIIPELMEGMGMRHFNKPADVLEHNLLACRYVKNSLHLRLAALLHDVGKPGCAVEGKKGLEFPGHHLKSVETAKHILKNLRFDSKTIKKVLLLIEHHMFVYSPDSPLSEARRLISRVGWQNIYDLIELRMADRLASGFNEAAGPGLKKLINDLEELKKENSDYKIKDLAVSGKELIETLGIRSGPIVGKLLNRLLEDVIENPELNSKRTLLELAEKYLKEELYEDRHYQ